MILFPEVQQAAQEEIDSVVGSTRLPSWDDSPKLPYMMAVVKESIRCTVPRAKAKRARKLTYVVQGCQQPLEAEYLTQRLRRIFTTVIESLLARLSSTMFVHHHGDRGIIES